MEVHIQNLENESNLVEVHERGNNKNRIVKIQIRFTVDFRMFILVRMSTSFEFVKS